MWLYSTPPSYSPFYILAEAYRAILLYHHAPNLIGLGYVSILGIAMASLMLPVFSLSQGLLRIGILERSPDISDDASPF